jgi:hypothetical protein
MAVLALGFGGLIACSPRTSNIYGQRTLPQPPAPQIPQYKAIPPDKIQWITVDGGQGELDFNPQVDILFVIDNSDSMKSAEANLVRNINSFASGLRKNKMIDYHIGVTSVWDSSPRYVENKNNTYGIGELRNVKDASGALKNERFITKTSNDNLLASTLNIGVAPYSEGGPEIEEVFSPIAAALQKTGRGAPNEGFFRDDAQLVTVILTDADDSTSAITPEQLAQKLFDFKKGKADKVSVYAALVKASDPDESKDWGLRVHPKYHPECFDGNKRNGNCAKGFGPDRIIDFILAANADHGTPTEIRATNLMSLVQRDFGQDLAKIGNDIAVKTLAKKIALPERPRQDDQTGELMIRVHYGNQVIPAGQKAGWVYNANTNSIEIAGDVPYQYQENAHFVVEMVPVTLRNP